MLPLVFKSFTHAEHVTAHSCHWFVAMGTVTGAMLPLGFQKMGLDPALMSNPLIAAVVDVVGVIIYYNVARIVIVGG